MLVAYHFRSDKEMLLDYFENQYTHSRKLKEKGHVFKTGPWRILFVLEVDQIRVLRIIQ